MAANTTSLNTKSLNTIGYIPGKYTSKSAPESEIKFSLKEKIMDCLRYLSVLWDSWGKPTNEQKHLLAVYKAHLTMHKWETNCPGVKHEALKPLRETIIDVLGFTKQKKEFDCAMDMIGWVQMSKDPKSEMNRLQLKSEDKGTKQISQCIIEMANSNNSSIIGLSNKVHEAFIAFRKQLDGFSYSMTTNNIEENKGYQKAKEELHTAFEGFMAEVSREVGTKYGEKAAFKLAES